MLTPKVREALQAELEHLRIRREQLVEAINDRIRALEAVLKPEEELDAMGAYYPVPEVLRDGALPARPTAATLAGKGLRESIRIVLSHYPTGLFPSDIATRLEEMGFAASGNLSIAKRVYGELYRMRQKGIVSKRGRRYLMTEA
jgi:hypothetical protein